MVPNSVLRPISFVNDESKCFLGDVDSLTVGVLADCHAPEIGNWLLANVAAGEVIHSASERAADSHLSREVIDAKYPFMAKFWDMVKQAGWDGSAICGYLMSAEAIVVFESNATWDYFCNGSLSRHNGRRPEPAEQPPVPMAVAPVEPEEEAPGGFSVPFVIDPQAVHGMILATGFDHKFEKKEGECSHETNKRLEEFEASWHDYFTEMVSETAYYNTDWANESFLSRAGSTGSMLVLQPNPATEDDWNDW